MKLPIGIQDFERLRTQGYLYVDKTESVWKMVQSGTYYFLSRPRRFGKSLLMSTIHAYFEGKKELFNGLYIADKEQKWEKYPVLHIDLNTEEYKTPEALVNKLDNFLCKWEELYGRSESEKSLGVRFEGAIERAYQKTGNRVVILVDEYDKPLLQAIGNPELQDDYRSILKGFYGALKSKDGCIQFALLTGVTKFGKVSVFSDLNNLNDISMDAGYYDICGITEQELLSVFDSQIDALATANEITREECIDTLRSRYDGYHFEETVPGIYNPFSVLNTFGKNKFGSYWFETGTPTYLVKLLQQSDFNLPTLEHIETTEKVLNSIDLNSKSPIPVIYQSGYLTIKGYDKEYRLFQLGFPNEEVKEGFLDFLLPCYSGLDEVSAPFEIMQFCRNVKTGNTEGFVKRLKSFFANTPYELIKDTENYYQNVIFLLCRLMGFRTQAEFRTSEGRIDLVIRTEKFCYVIEFKLDGTAEEALQQIQDKNYTLPFELDGQQIVRIGINFSSTSRTIDRYIVG